MSLSSVEVIETFVSLQGESTYAGLPCFFIRLAGCNLQCRYCDTAYARGRGKTVPAAALARACRASHAPLVEITGGEPLLQPGFPALARGLRDRTRAKVLVETNGSLDISIIPPRVTAIMDIKCPGSGEAERTDMANIGRLRPYDEVKFVILDRRDYEWARRVVRRQGLAETCRAVLFSPVHGKMDPLKIAAWLVRDRLPVRLQLQLHRRLGVK